MKLLALSDLHGDYSHVGAIIDRVGDFDAVLLAGDITNFGPDDHALELLKMFKQPVLAVPGNCDNPSLLDVLDKTISLHNTVHTLQGFNFIGLGGSNPTPFNTPFELSEKKIGEYVGILLSKLNGLNGKTVLLSHAPPFNTTDRVERGNIGSEALARFLGRIDLIVCGHIHEARGSVCVKGTCVVNPGPASKGYGAVITIKDDIKTEFIDT